MTKLKAWSSKKLKVISRAGRYFTPKHRLTLYRAKVRPHMEYCFHVWVGALHYKLDPFDRIQRRSARIIGDPMICERLDNLALRRDVSSLCVLYRIYHGEFSEELFDWLPTAEFPNCTVCHKLKHYSHHLDKWHFTTVLFHRNFRPRPRPRNCRMTYLILGAA